MAEPHCSYTGAANVEPAPEIVPLAEALLELLVVLLELLPHAATPSDSTAAPRIAPAFLLITASPLSLWLTARRGAPGPLRAGKIRGDRLCCAVSSVSGCDCVNIP